MAVAESGVSALPPLYARWMDQLLQAPIPDEERATCGACAMCAPGSGAALADDDAGPAVRFEPGTKCCTFQPSLPCFLVGGVLRDEDPAMAAGRKTVRARIAARIGVTPRGLRRTPAFALLYRHGLAAFGRSASLRCPHLVVDGDAADATGGARCGIWRHREATCATWFCKHRRGATSMGFWRRGLQPLLEAVEESLALHCAHALDLDDTALDWLLQPHPHADDPLDAADLDGRVDDERYRAWWGRRAGSEEAYFEACAEIVEALSWKQVAALGGAELTARAALCRVLYRQLLDETLPSEPLALGRVEVEPAGAAGVRLYTYSPFDALAVSRAAFDALPRGVGWSPERIASALAASLPIEENAPAGDREAAATTLVRALYDAEVLVPVSSLARPRTTRERTKRER